MCCGQACSPGTGLAAHSPFPFPTDETSFEAGIRVQIHSQDEPPYIHQLGFGVSPGFQTFVSCQEQRVSRAQRGGVRLSWCGAKRESGWAVPFVEMPLLPMKLPTSAGWCMMSRSPREAPPAPSTTCRCSGTLSPWQLTYLPQPWGNCRASVQGEQMLPGYDTYSIAACRLQCEKEAVVRSCHCRMVHMPGEGCACRWGAPQHPPPPSQGCLFQPAPNGHLYLIPLYPRVTPFPSFFTQGSPHLSATLSPFPVCPASLGERA